MLQCGRDNSERRGFSNERDASNGIHTRKHHRSAIAARATATAAGTPVTSGVMATGGSQTQQTYQEHHTKAAAGWPQQGY